MRLTRIIALACAGPFLVGIAIAGSAPASAIISSDRTNGDAHIVNDSIRWGYVGRMVAHHNFIRRNNPLNGGAYEECTAVLIGPRIALTAKHCFGGVDRAPTIAFGGIRMPGGSKIQSPVDSVVTHVMAQQSSGDMSVAVLDREVSITPALLAVPTDVSLIAKGSDVEMLGWGNISRQGDTPIIGDGITSAELRRATGVVRETTHHAFPSYNPFDANNGKIGVNAGGSLPGYTSFGDSGGPLLANDNGIVKLVGIDSSKGGYFEPVYSKEPWISKTITKLLANNPITTGATATT